MRNLFDIEEQEPDWKKEWKDMPEFIQEDQKPIQQIIVSFASFDDVQKFADLLGMNVTTKTKSTWFPHRPHRKYTMGYGTEE